MAEEKPEELSVEDYLNRRLLTLRVELNKRLIEARRLEGAIAEVEQMLGGISKTEESPQKS